MSQNRKTLLTMGAFGCFGMAVVALGSIDAPLDIIDLGHAFIAVTWAWVGVDLLRWRWEVRR